jgi:hypothetical protein
MLEERGKEDWLALVPGLSIEGKPSIEEISFSPSRLSEISAVFWEEGYISLQPLFEESELSPIRKGIYAMAARDIPPVYIYLFDQPWWLFARLGVLLRHFVGEKFGVLPNLWAWHLDRVGARGWPPHRDCDVETVFGEGEDAVLMSLSLWIPLTDTDEDNGCMYALPRASTAATVTNGQPNLSKGRPLPANAGSVLGWPQDLYHWGGAYSREAKKPRVSISLEFQNRAFAPLAEPLIDMTRLPRFERRRDLIETQFEKYRHIDPTLSAER